MEYCEEPIVDFFLKKTTLHSDKILYYFYNKNMEVKKLSYGELHKHASYIATLLDEKRVKKGDVVLLSFSPGLNLISTLFGCLYVGCIPVITQYPQNNKLQKKIIKICEDCQPKLIITTSLKEEALFTSPPFDKYNVLNITEANELDYMNLDLLNRNISLDDTAFIQYSSGSTDHPKGIVITHKNLSANSKIMIDGFCVNDKVENIVSWLPPYHDMGLMSAIFLPIFSGATSHQMSPNTFLRYPHKWLKLISMLPNVLAGGPDFCYKYCVDKVTAAQMKDLDFKNWVVAFNGSEPIHYETLELFDEKFKQVGFNNTAFCPCYGLAEATLAVSSYRESSAPIYLPVNKSALRKNKIVVESENIGSIKKIVNCGRAYQDLVIVNQNTTLHDSNPLQALDN